MMSVVGRVLWWLCGVGECGFSHHIVVLCVVHKCGFVLLVSMGRLSGLKWVKLGI